MRMAVFRFAAVLAIAACGSCTAVKVVTHSASSDPVDAPAGRYHLDPKHWSVTFDVDHLGYSRFTMRFDRVRADLDFQPQDPEKSHLAAVIDAASLDTNVAELDKMVTDSAVLNVGAYPEIRFESKNLHRTGQNTGEMVGELTICGQTRPVTLNVTFNGGAPNPLTGEQVLGFTATGHFDRAAFGVSNWYPAVGREIRVTIQAEFAQPAKG